MRYWKEKQEFWQHEEPEWFTRNEAKWEDSARFSLAMWKKNYSAISLV